MTVDVIEAQIVPKRNTPVNTAFFLIDVVLTIGFTVELVQQITYTYEGWGRVKACAKWQVNLLQKRLAILVRLAGSDLQSSALFIVFQLHAAVSFT